tara:strand:+ start:752 stop:1648 length:897 start_codon:yes stop_codon:yes gene_type:complete
MNNKPIWLDLELRKDIDDYMTLIYALDKDVNIQEISIHNPSMKELKLLKNTLNLYKKNIPIIVSGDITEYPEDEDIHSSLLEKAQLDNENFYCYLNDYFDYKKDIGERTFFCGGSLYTLSQCLNNYNPENFKPYIQGGFAGKDVVGIENTLKKFKKRNEVPTWNLNLDIKSTDDVLSKNVDIHLISKNICHASFVGLEDLNNKNSYFNNTLKNYFNGSERKKCMHDLLAFMTIFDEKNELVQFKKVDLTHSDHEIPKWKSVINENSNKQISSSFDYSLFLKLIKEHTPKQKLKNKFNY